LGTVVEVLGMQVAGVWGLALEREELSREALGYEEQIQEALGCEELIPEALERGAALLGYQEYWLEVGWLAQKEW
jgi:hypothetical protein